VSGVLLWAGVLVLGGCGAMLRTGVGAAIDGRRRTAFPLGTFAVNLSGGFLAGLLDGAEVAGDAGLLVSTGLIGAYTTFSTWMGDSETLVRGRQVQMAMLNLLGSLLLGVCAALLGKVVGAAFF
jgi:fluoride exporter